MDAYIDKIEEDGVDYEEFLNKMREKYEEIH
jgi:hypothetical protein